MGRDRLAKRPGEIHRPRPRLRPERGWPFGLVLAVLFGTVVIVSVGLAMTVALRGALDNATGLLSRQADLTVVDLTERIRAELAPIESQADWLAAAVLAGEVRIGDSAAFKSFVRGLLGATPQINGILHIDRRLRAHGLNRANTKLTRTDITSARAVRNFNRDFARFEKDPTPFWGPPVFVPSQGLSLVSRRTPVHDIEGRLTGILLSSITVAQLSRYLATLAERLDQIGFILYGRDRVLAHPSLVAGVDTARAGRALPPLAEIEDPVLREIWRQGEGKMRLLSRVRQVSVHEVEVDGEAYIFQWRAFADLGPEPWIVGTYYPRGALAEVTGPLWIAAAASAAVLLAAIAIAAGVARALSRPLRRIAAAARDVSQFRFDRVRPLPRTSVAELNEAAAAFNAMVVAVRWFQDYVPRSLVQRLMNTASDTGVAVEEREVTVMFTDMADFSGLVEHMTPSAMAMFLNRHFALLAQVVEETGGTIDKYMGDGMLAYWGAPEHLSDHAVRACTAAQRITETIRAANEARLKAGEPPVRLRIGINSGPAVVGNIGAPGRINYTIVGGTINVAERLEELGHGFYTADAATTVLISESCRRAIGDAFDVEALGPHRLRGNPGDPVPVYRLRAAEAHHPAVVKS